MRCMVCIEDYYNKVYTVTDKSIIYVGIDAFAGVI